jgi:hypothetical protein
LTSRVADHVCLQKALKRLGLFERPPEHGPFAPPHRTAVLADASLFIIHI